MQFYRRPCRQRLIGLAGNVVPPLIGESLAEIAVIAEITGDVGSALRPTDIGR
jgi:hypothetical protein